MPIGVGEEDRFMGLSAGIIGERRPPAFMVIDPAVTIDRVLVAEDLPPTIVAGPLGAFSLRSPCHAPPPVNNLHPAYERSRPAFGQMTMSSPLLCGAPFLGQRGY